MQISEILNENQTAYKWLSDYTYDGMNKYPSSNIISYLLKKYPNETSMTVYRGLHFDSKDQYDDFITNLKNNGYTLTLQNISSWSPSFSTAEDFAMTKKSYFPTASIMSQEMEMNKTKEYMSGYKGIVIKTTIAPNTGINVSNTKHVKEDEIILPKGTYKVEIKTIKKKFKDHIEDGDETIKSIIDKMLDPKFKDDHFYQKFYDFIKHTYPDQIKAQSEFKDKIYKILVNRLRTPKVEFVDYNVDQHYFDDHQTVSIYFNRSLFELYENGFLPDDKKEIIVKYANKIINLYYNLVKEYNGPDYDYKFGDLTYLEKFATPESHKKIKKMQQIQIGNTYNKLNSRETVDKINKISDPNDRKKQMKKYMDDLTRTLNQFN